MSQHRRGLLLRRMTAALAAARAGEAVDRDALARVAVLAYDQHGPDMHSIWDRDRWLAVIDAVLAARGDAAPSEPACGGCGRTDGVQLPDLSGGVVHADCDDEVPAAPTEVRP
jgi:hypothetical protein